MVDYLVFGAIEIRPRTRLQGLRVFLNSLYTQDPGVRLVMFNHTRGHEELNAILKPYGIVDVDATVYERKYGIPVYAYHIATARFLKYEKWLEKHKIPAAICSDVLDVVWQGDPKRLIPERGLRVFEENHPIGTCPYNRRWVLETCTEAEQALLWEQPIICAGLIAGTRDALLEYFAFYRERMSVRRPRRGYDQGILNLYSYTHDVQRIPYKNELCRHLGYAPPETVKWWRGVKVDGLRPVVAHQYKVHAEVMAAVEARWI